MKGILNKMNTWIHKLNRLRADLSKDPALVENRGDGLGLHIAVCMSVLAVVVLIVGVIG